MDLTAAKRGIAQDLRRQMRESDRQLKADLAEAKAAVKETTEHLEKIVRLGKEAFARKEPVSGEAKRSYHAAKKAAKEAKERLEGVERRAAHTAKKAKLAELDPPNVDYNPRALGLQGESHEERLQSAIEDLRDRISEEISHFRPAPDQREVLKDILSKKSLAELRAVWTELAPKSMERMVIAKLGKGPEEGHDERARAALRGAWVPGLPLAVPNETAAAGQR